jgi:hypothetical protein
MVFLPAIIIYFVFLLTDSGWGDLDFGSVSLIVILFYVIGMLTGSALIPTIVVAIIYVVYLTLEIIEDHK